ncbi:MAG TPA: transposase, partial [Alphaproteobacteria bacterium]|nr:transposase [Alphaproteobacteria bacterium]HQS93560.1 transposase [Alphaproteobacteria bacterium]
ESLSTTDSLPGDMERIRSDLLEDSVRGMEAALRKALLKYNSYRPHRNLKGLTPLQYIQNSSLQAA